MIDPQPSLPNKPVPWADSESYQSAQSNDESKRDREERERSERPWFDALSTAAPKLREDVERAFRKWNLIVRSHLRDETGLRLTQSGSGSSIPVVVTDGLPLPFRHKAEIFNELAPILVRLPLLEATRDGLAFVVESRTQTDQILRSGQHADLAGLPTHYSSNSASYVEALIDQVQQAKVLESLLAIREDVLGAYFFNQSKVRLYWMPIGIIALALGLSVEALTVVVLAHELAHAYTHHGRDINQQSWDTTAFAAADDRIVEGLAQHYTEMVCQKLSAWLPEANVAFTKLRKDQSVPYTDYTTWVEDGQKKNVGEIMRAAMLAVRYSKETDYSKFRQRLKSRAVLKGITEDEKNTANQ